MYPYVRVSLNRRKSGGEAVYQVCSIVSIQDHYDNTFINDHVTAHRTTKDTLTEERQQYTSFHKHTPYTIVKELISAAYTRWGFSIMRERHSLTSLTTAYQIRGHRHTHSPLLPKHEPDGRHMYSGALDPY